MNSKFQPPAFGFETHLCRYPWTERFQEVQFIVGGEGSSIFSAVGEGLFWLIADNGTLADFLPEDE